MNLKELAAQPTIQLQNGKHLAKISDHEDHTIFINPASLQEHGSEKDTYSVELAITPSFKFKEADQDFEEITKLMHKFGEIASVKVKLSSRHHVYFESLHSVHGKNVEGKHVKLTYIKTHISTI